ncbi:protein translocase subunit SecF [Elioraea tepida]|uniref:Protein-export membrane protein SecF n=1 Tax=Elioraea tepida TaxID=2843330 RepID=A0A975U3B0_9PROT|nr:protein translocase subunit SecF [Elioraea tepida]QXM24603.1 protein translocase subunit SecF [Elioraea tepida]
MPLRLVRDGTTIPFMRGRMLGLAMSAFLSIASVVLFFTPGLNYGLDFRGGIVMELRTPEPANFAQLRSGLEGLNLGSVALQQFGSPNEVLIRLERQPDEGAQQRAVAAVRSWLEQAVPGARIVRIEAVGARVSAELFTAGMTALGVALLAMLLYIWFRFEWEYGVGAVVTLILDVTKAIGFLALTRIEFDLATVAAILTIIGYSVNDKVVVYDRMRENLRKYKTMPLREVIDLSINETLNRTIGTSLTTFLACLPLALIATGPVAAFAWVMLFGIVVGTSSSIFIAAPILLFLGEKRLRKGGVEEAKAPA